MIVRLILELGRRCGFLPSNYGDGQLETGCETSRVTSAAPGVFARNVEERDGFEPSVRIAIPRSHHPHGDSGIAENPQ